MTIDELIAEAHRTAELKGWWLEDQTPNIPEKLALVHSEVSEALEELRLRPADCWDVGVLQPDGSSTKPEGFVVELADAIIRIADLCGYLDLPLTEALRRKLEYNKTRLYRHGGKNF